MALRNWQSRISKILFHPTTSKVFNSVAFYAGYTALVVYAAAHQPAKGLYILAGLMALHFILSRQRRKDILFITSVTLLGVAIDCFYLQTSVIAYASPNTLVEWLPPMWIVGLYVLFATAVDYSLFWLRHHLTLAAVLGALGGVSSYVAGVKVGAAQLLLPDGLSLVVIGAVWFFLMPAVCWYSNLLDTWFDRVP